MSKASVARDIRTWVASAAMTLSAVFGVQARVSAQGLPQTLTPDGRDRGLAEIMADTTALIPPDTARYRLSAHLNPYEAYIQYGLKSTPDGASSRSGLALRGGVLNVSLGSSLNNMGFPFLSARDNTPYPAPFQIAGLQGHAGTDRLYFSPIAGYKAAVGNKPEVDSLRFVWGFTGGLILGHPDRLQFALASGVLYQDGGAAGLPQHFIGTGMELKRLFGNKGALITLGVNSQMRRDPTVRTPDNYTAVYKYFGEFESPNIINKPLEISGIFNVYGRAVEQKNMEGVRDVIHSYGATFGGMVSLTPGANTMAALSIDPGPDRKGKRKHAVRKLLYETKIGFSVTADSKNGFSPNIEIRQSLKKAPGSR